MAKHETSGSKGIPGPSEMRVFLAAVLIFVHGVLLVIFWITGPWLGSIEYATWHVVEWLLLVPAFVVISSVYGSIWKSNRVKAVRAASIMGWILAIAWTAVTSLLVLDELTYGRHFQGDRSYTLILAVVESYVLLGLFCMVQGVALLLNRARPIADNMVYAAGFLLILAGIMFATMTMSFYYDYFFLIVFAGFFIFPTGLIIAGVNIRKSRIHHAESIPTPSG